MYNCTLNTGKLFNYLVSVNFSNELSPRSDKSRLTLKAKRMNTKIDANRIMSWTKIRHSMRIYAPVCLKVIQLC